MGDVIYPVVGLLMGAAIGALITFLVMRSKANPTQQGYPPQGYPQQPVPHLPQGYPQQPNPQAQGYPPQPNPQAQQMPYPAAGYSSQPYPPQ